MTFYRNYEEYRYNAMLDVDCKKHGKSLSESGDCIKCLEEADMEARSHEGTRGICGGCAFADYERSNDVKTWCTAWSKRGFPVTPRKRYCSKRVDENLLPDDQDFDYPPCDACRNYNNKDFPCHALGKAGCKPDIMEE